MRRLARCAAAAAALALAGPAGAGTVRDAVGRSVAVPDAPRRIVSLAPSITETLFALGLAGRVVGVTDQCDWPPEAASRPRVGGVVNPSLEAVVALRPDLVVATADGNRAEDVHGLAALGIAVYTIDTRRLEDVPGSIATLGALAGARERGAGLAAELARRRAAVQSRLAGASPVPAFVALERSPLITAGPGTFVGEMLALAGGRSVAGPTRVKYPVFSLERLLAADPEVIVDAADPEPVPPGRVRARWEALPGAAGLRAVRNGRLVSVGQGTFFRPGPRIMASLERLAEILHPERPGAADRTPSAAAPATAPGRGARPGSP